MSAAEPEASLAIPVEFPEPQGIFSAPFSLRKVFGMLRYFGPAAVAASVSIGAGETLIVVVTGAWARYQLLWLVLLACLIKGFFVTYLLGRYTALTGEHLGHRLVRLPGPKGWLLLALIFVELSSAGPISAVIGAPCGNLLAHAAQDYLPGKRLADGNLTQEALKSWETILAVGFLLAALCLSLALSYEKLEKQNLILCLILVGGTVLSSFIIQPDLLAALKGFFIPSLPLSPWKNPAGVAVPPEAAQLNLKYVLLLITVFGYVGNTVFGYVAYANWIGIHGWGLTGHPRIKEIRAYIEKNRRYDYLPSDARQIGLAKKLLSPLRWDASMGCLVLLIVTASFMMAGARVFFPRIDADPSHALPAWGAVLTEQRFVWQELHVMLVPVYYICAVAALWGTLNALPEIWARVTHEFLSAIWPRTSSFSRSNMQRLIVALTLCLGITLIVKGAKLPLLAGIVATLTTNIGVTLACGAGLYINATLPKGYRLSRGALICGGLGLAVLTLSSVGGIIGLLQQAGVLK